VAEISHGPTTTDNNDKHSPGNNLVDAGVISRKKVGIHARRVCAGRGVCSDAEAVSSLVIMRSILKEGACIVASVRMQNALVSRRSESVC
jgi:hypothetical protein